MLYQSERREMCKIVKSMYDRWLTNAAGGNLSWKVSDNHYIMTASGLSSKYLWDIDPENILVVDDNLNIIEGRGKVTREINMHMEIYKNDDKVKAVIHAHPKELMIYACMGIDMPIVSEALEFLGEKIPCLPYRPATTKELAELVGSWTSSFSKEFTEKELIMEDIYAYAALLCRHGVIVASDNLFSANEMLERLETNAYVHIHAAILESRGYIYNR
ncbi:class II aldolase/adducin family protein [Tepidimicrobium xylanilyticum]|uniref:class II aldolase/adducin family protein n=1 Tax=Tepidimicrobium xylanilyticum TaxID=1123352 RepID=UPI002653F437|nr:class II aldolase/adducin family protein [Tepidimicrobium xylanilyticum]GMG95614.1 L-fuculose-phosphate aldolase [Tepidimicrobium xylanilyticum]